MHPNFTPSPRAGWPTLLAAAAAAALAACSGGGESPALEPAPATGAVVSGQAAVGSADGRKGVLAGSTACLDVDGDGRCGPSEPQATTGADGGFALAVTPASAGAGLVVEVPATATADGVAVGRAFTLRAPAGSAAVTPLSALVMAEIDTAGGTLAEAAERLRQRGALVGSPVQALGEGDAARLAALLRRLAALQADALAGSDLPSADIAREVARVQAAALADLAQAARDGVGDDTLQAIAERLGPDAAQVAAAGRMFALAEPPVPATPQPTIALNSFRYVDSDNWSLLALQSSADDTVPDSIGSVRYHDVYARMGAPAASIPRGVAQRWSGWSILQAAGTLHFNGSGWVTCGGLAARYRSTLRDLSGRGSYDFCDNRESGATIRRGEDISGQQMDFVVRDKIRTLPGSSAGVSFVNFGPANLSLLAGRSFPEGSYLFYQQNTITGSNPSYDPREINRVLVFSASVAAGGDSRSSPGLDCANPVLNADSTRVPAATLEELIARNAGRPCIFLPFVGSTDASLNPNEWWGQSSINLGDLANFNTRPAGTGGYYTTNASLRATFTAGGRVRFHRCFRRNNTAGGPYNCTLLGLGTWRIETLGDARVLSFSTVPAIVQRLGFTRVFVERGGAVYIGSRQPVGVVVLQARLNLTAANAMFDALPGMPEIRPTRQPGTASGADAAALSTVQGAWGAATLTEATLFRFGVDGRFLMAEAKPYVESTREQSGGELGWFDLNTATGRLSTLLEVDSNLTSGTSHPREADPPLSVSDTAISNGAGFSLARLRDDRTTDLNSLVGLWALDSATDLAANHYAIFANGRMLVSTQLALEDSDCLSAGQCPPGAEYASYTWNPVTGAFSASLLAGETTLPSGQRLNHYDTNGCGGFFQTCAAAVTAGTETRTVSFSLTLAADGRTFTVFDRGRNTTLYRVDPRAPAPVAITDDTQIRSEFPDTNYGSEPVFSPFRSTDGTAGVGLIQIPLERIPASAARVFLNLNVVSCPPRDRTARFEIYRVSSSWRESAVTWATAPGIDRSRTWAEDSFPSAFTGVRRYDITELVRAWRAGTHPNHGVAVDNFATPANVDCSFGSAEPRENVPPVPDIKGVSPFLSFE